MVISNLLLLLLLLLLLWKLIIIITITMIISNLLLLLLILLLLLLLLVYEESTEIDLGLGQQTEKAKIKQRILSQIISPASKTYLYNLNYKSEDIKFNEESRPIIGIIKTIANGYTLCKVYLNEKVLLL